MTYDLSKTRNSYNNMANAKRITIMVSEDVDKKIRNIQAKRITTTQSSYSYSRAIDEILRKGLKI